MCILHHHHEPNPGNRQEVRHGGGKKEGGRGQEKVKGQVVVVHVCGAMGTRQEGKVAGSKENAGVVVCGMS